MGMTFKMKYKIAFFSEARFTGKTARDHPNRRTEICWYAALDAVHKPIWTISQVLESENKYDLGILIIPKKNVAELMTFPLVDNLRKVCKKIAVMQEGPHSYFQDYPIEQQIWYFNTLQEMDFLLCHNKIDVKYYHGLTDKPCYTMPSLMLTDGLKIAEEKKDAVIIGGNMCSWYGGFDSYITAMTMNLPVYPIFVPSMGRKITGEESLDRIKHLPYLSWTQWIATLSEMKYGIHLMRTHAAGTFALNCSFLGIPCIGYKGLDTQEKLHPELTIKVGDIDEAKYFATKLKEDEEFYRICEIRTKHLYKVNYSEEVFLEHMNEIFKKELGK